MSESIQNTTTETHAQSPIQSINIESLLRALKLWSLLVFPGIGFILGITIRIFLAAIFGWNHTPSLEIWIAHMMTMAFMITTLNDNLYNSQAPEDPREKAFMLCFTYLGLFGCILGLCPKLI